MKTYNWKAGNVNEGLALTSDERLGQVVFLGEGGRGRRYEKIALGRRNPAEVVDGKILEAHPVKITLKAKEGKPEKSFYVLEKPRHNNDQVLIRICTLTSYIRGASGRYIKVEGEPETLISGYGAFGAAGRVGSWDDGLVVMKAGDVLRVYPSRSQYSYALWLEDGKPITTTWKDYENIQAVAKAQEMIEQAEESPESLDVVYGSMKAFTFSGDHITEGIRVSDGATGKVIAFGEEGRGRSRVEVPLVGIEATTQSDNYGRTSESLIQTAVVKLEEKTIPARYSWEEAKVKTTYGLTQSDKQEDAFLIRVSTSGPYTKGTAGVIDPWKGSPVVLTSGSGAHGAAGRVGGWDDALLVMREGDALFVRQEGGYKSAGPWAVYVEGGQLRCELWQEWKLKDAKRTPDFYVAKGTAPMGHVPSEWIGKVVTVCYLSQGQSGCGPTKTYVEDRATGELVRIEAGSVILNLGWDGKDYHESSVSGSWVKLEKDKQVRQLDGEALEKRKQIRAQAEELRNKAIAATQKSYFNLTEANLREQVQETAREQSFDTMPTEGWYDSLTSWVEKANDIIEKFEEAARELETLEKRQSSGDVLVDFGGHFRRMGNSGNGDFWVVSPDGSLREPDEVSYRKRYISEGNKQWRLISDDELALKWSCGTMRDVSGSSEFIVAKMPVNGITEAQREAVRRIELEDIGTTENSFGLDPEAAERQAKVIAEAANAFPSCPACGEKLVYDESTYRSMTGEYGIQICQDDHRISRLVNWNKPFDQYTEGRDAQVISSKRTSNGMIEALAYEKWGGWNINLRLRKLTEEELAQAERVEETTQGDGNFTFVGGRYFKCSCGCQNRVTKSEMRSCKSGGTLEITCSVCGAKGKVSENTAQDSGETDDKSMESALDALKRKWGSR
jgi:hypothetical protein